ncbi:hypothetical protein AMECASPLE_033641 [Ameca splendens]|uniref:Ig-like domain-containing protein n=1 Tax=Ameca splendens TaxID=208324 RepID=A0ABV0Z4T1_9TELE
MIFIYIIMPVLVLATLATGIMECNLTQSEKDYKCYGAPGEPLIFHFPVHARIELKKNDTVVCKSINNTSVSMNSRCNTTHGFFINGTFKFDNTMKTDSGVYQLDAFDNDGKTIRTMNIILQILVPVSHPAMIQACLSPEQTTVNCSAEGDDTEFSFSLDNNPLIQTKAGSPKNKSVTISLSGQLRGNLHCKVQNKVSSKQTVIHLTSCKAACFQTVIILASVTILLLLLIVLLSIKLCKTKRSSTTITDDNAEDEIVYSDVRVTRAAQRVDV